jgi:hypothetical protein
MSFKARVAGLLWTDLRSSSFAAAWAAAFAAITFIKLDVMHPANTSIYLQALESVMPLWLWGLAFAVYSLTRFASALQYQTSRVEVITACVGMALWASLFAAGTVLQTTTNGLAILYCVPAAFEVWALAQVLARRFIHA